MDLLLNVVQQWFSYQDKLADEPPSSSLSAIQACGVGFRVWGLCQFRVQSHTPKRLHPRFSPAIQACGIKHFFLFKKTVLRHADIHMYIRVCVCVCVRARARVHVCVHIYGALTA